jgi:hypothetical protein
MGREICICMIKSKKCIGHRCVEHQSEFHVFSSWTIPSHFVSFLLEYILPMLANFVTYSSCYQVVAQPNGKCDDT